MTMLVINDFRKDFVDFLTISKFSFPAIYIENKYTIHVIATYVPCIVCVFVNKFFKFSCYKLNFVSVLFRYSEYFALIQIF